MDGFNASFIFEKTKALSVVDRRRAGRSEEHTSELQSQSNLVCRLLLVKKKLHHPRHVRAGDGAAGDRRSDRLRLGVADLRAHGCALARFLCALDPWWCRQARVERLPVT